MPGLAFLLAIPSIIRTVIASLPPWVWKLIAAALILLTVFFYGYNKGKGVERAKCERAAQLAQKAANDQDLQAERDGRKQDLEITDTLTQQKKVDDATIETLRTQLKSRPTGAKCEYDKSTADPDDQPKPRSVRNKK